MAAKDKNIIKLLHSTSMGKCSKMYFIASSQLHVKNTKISQISNKTELYKTPVKRLINIKLIRIK